MSIIQFPTSTERDGCPDWCAPFHIVERALVGTRFADLFDVDDFMLMDRIVRKSSPNLVLGKHFITRRYLNLDEHGNAYRYGPPRDPDSTSVGRYTRYPNLLDAVSHLELELFIEPGRRR